MASDVARSAADIVYPESDGVPMADNSRQLLWMLTIIGNLRALYCDRADVFVCGNMFWYPVEGHPEVRLAPDALVVYGRPNVHRGSYKQWEEEDVPLTVMFEILSPGNTAKEMIDKLLFYEEYGVEEYYVFSPELNQLEVYVRHNEQLLRRRFATEFVSPRMGIRFVPSEPELQVFHPDGRIFSAFEELASERADAERRADSAELRARRIAQLSRAARQNRASDEELAELDRLERESLS